MVRRQIVETGFEPGADQPAVACGTAPAGAFGVKDDDFTAGARQLQAGAKPGVARANHHHVGAFRLCANLNFRARGGIPPIRRGFKIICEQRLIGQLATLLASGDPHFYPIGGGISKYWRPLWLARAMVL